ncbi:hypothetical protein PRZ48_008152 [Zasmidium cellare]|uniref:Rad60/SUMO-like domain-containing protein n=1 Tax=Zasmidium cellare TaxID=395010 RepID=A0ABR0EEP1_ZASCE|nr:hypothetical protein PRZ48_008152 [Zasmidium cellare]
MSFFKAPAWAQPQAAKAEEDDNDEDLFSHKGSFMSMFKDQSARQKKEKEREERRKAKKEGKRKSSEKRDSEEPAIKSEYKKRRITSEESSKLLAKAGLGAVINLSDGEDDEPVQQQQQSPVRTSPRLNRTKNILSPARSKSKLAASIDVGNESEDDFHVTAVKAAPRPAPPEPEEPYDSDPEIAEMQREAREKARATQRETASATSPGSRGTPNATSSTPPALDPVVRILVTSKIPDTNPLIVCRKLSQRLREVREMWCKKQKFSDQFTAKVFFVHRGRQYWDSTTVRRLGLEAYADGTVYRTDDPSQEDVDQVHVEAVTQEMFEQMKAEKARQAKAAVGVYDEEEEQADEGAEEEPAADNQIRLVVKAKGRQEWKVIVKPTTLIATIMKKGKTNLGFADDQEVYLEFDGERLEPTQTVAGTEIEDMFCIEMFPAS